MTTIISNTQKSFRFDDEFINFNLLNPHYIITIIVTEKKYDTGILYYYIDYEYDFIKSNDKTDKENQNFKKKCHPFNKFDNSDNVKFSGVITIKNDLISTMIKFLLMDDEELEKYTGDTTQQAYRSCIMESLSHFWD